MNLGHLSIRQPVLAMVLSIVLLIVGGIAYTQLPVAEYPQVALPTIVVTTQYPGASSQTVAEAEARHVRGVVANTKGHRGEAARILGITRKKRVEASFVRLRDS